MFGRRYRSRGQVDITATARGELDDPALDRPSRRGAGRPSQCAEPAGVEAKPCRCRSRCSQGGETGRTRREARSGGKVIVTVDVRFQTQLCFSSNAVEHGDDSLCFRRGGPAAVEPHDIGPEPTVEPNSRFGHQLIQRQ